MSRRHFPLPAAILAGLPLVLYSPLLFGGKVLYWGVYLLQFYPWRQLAVEQVRAGHWPLWNPYLFTGAPFLANPQAAVLYPLHWPLIWMEPSRALIWSALLHVWLAAGFMYTFARRSARLSAPASWLAGALFGLGGFTLAKIENINQLNALAWLPALLWLLDETARAGDWRARLRWSIALSAARAWAR